MKKTIQIVSALLLMAAISNAQTVVKEESQANDKVYDQADVMPQFQGGNDALQKYLSSTIKYPEAAKKNKEEGTVFVQFIVNALGNVVGAKVLKGATEGLNREALSVISNMPQWIPGKQDGKAVSIYLTLPVKFAL